MARDANGNEITVGTPVFHGPTGTAGTVERVFARDLDDEPLRLEGHEGTFPSAECEVCAGPEVPTSEPVQAPPLVVDGHATVPDGAADAPETFEAFCEKYGLPSTKDELLSYLAEQLSDDLRAIGHDLGIHNLHDLHKDVLEEAILNRIVEVWNLGGRLDDAPVVLEEGA